MKTIIVTGATGFIGTYVIKECLKKGFKVWAIVRKNSSKKRTIPCDKNITLLECEMDEYDKLLFQIKEADCFIHLAWEGVRRPQRDDSEIQQKNYENSVNAMYVAIQLGCKVFLGTGSQAEYGEMNGRVSEDFPCNPITEYGKKKLLACEKLWEIADKQSIRFIWTRIFSVYGSYDSPDTLIMTALKKMRNNEPINMTEGVQLWDYLHVEDAADAIMMLVENDLASGIYNVAKGEEKTLRTYIEEMKEVLDSSSELNFGVIPYGVNGPVDIRPDNRKILELGWRPKREFADGIGSIVYMTVN